MSESAWRDCPRSDASAASQTTAGKVKVLATRREVLAGWHAAADALLEAGQAALAQKIWGFIGGMQPPLTTDEQLTQTVEERSRTRERERRMERPR
jgi:hypothetical protein